MGLKHSIETVGGLRKAFVGIADDVPFEIMIDRDWTYLKMTVQSFHDNEREQFVRLEPIL